MGEESHRAQSFIPFLSFFFSCTSLVIGNGMGEESQSKASLLNRQKHL